MAVLRKARHGHGRLHLTSIASQADDGQHAQQFIGITHLPYFLWRSCKFATVPLLLFKQVRGSCSCWKNGPAKIIRQQVVPSGLPSLRSFLCFPNLERPKPVFTIVA
jgi:hypothetical protein